MYDRLLLPTDGSPGTDGAVEQALALADASESQVDALAVVDRTFPAAVEHDHAVESLESEAEAALESVVDAAKSVGVGVEPHLRRGVPHEEIVAAAAAYDSDLVVMGTHGRTGFDRIRSLGSVTERVVRTSPIPVLSVPLGPGRAANR